MGHLRVDLGFRQCYGRAARLRRAESWTAPQARVARDPIRNHKMAAFRIVASGLSKISHRSQPNSLLMDEAPGPYSSELQPKYEPIELGPRVRMIVNAHA